MQGLTMSGLGFERNRMEQPTNGANCNAFCHPRFIWSLLKTASLKSVVSFNLPALISTRLEQSGAFHFRKNPDHLFYLFLGGHSPNYAPAEFMNPGLA